MVSATMGDAAHPMAIVEHRSISAVPGLAEADREAMVSAPMESAAHAGATVEHRFIAAPRTTVGDCRVGTNTGNKNKQLKQSP
jgi:hypothetical protein